MLSYQDNNDIFAGYLPFYQTPQATTSIYSEYCDAAIQYHPEQHDVAIQYPEPDMAANN